MAGGSRLPGTPDDDDGRDSIVLHVDMDCFYAACERRRSPHLLAIIADNFGISQSILTR